jgi:hypothetical protein
MHALLGSSQLLSSPIEEGDAGIVLKADGTFRVFSTGKIDANNMTEAQLEQGEKLVALSIALSIPQILNTLKAMANDPEIVGQGVNLGETN